MKNNNNEILEIIYNEYFLNNNTVFEYNVIIKKLDEQDINFTYGELKEKLDNLEKENYIIKNDSEEKITLTENGIKFLQEKHKTKPIAYFVNN